MVTAQGHGMCDPALGVWIPKPWMVEGYFERRLICCVTSSTPRLHGRRVFISVQ
jgi:hypothetical protein